MASIHNKLERVRKPRVHIKYEVETEGARQLAVVGLVSLALRTWTLIQMRAANPLFAERCRPSPPPGTPPTRSTRPTAGASCRGPRGPGAGA